MDKPLKLSQILTYKPLSKYEGLEGNIPCRAKTTYVGVEIELEKVKRKYNSYPSSWNHTEDGSLKLDGLEFVTIPIKFCYLEKELERLFSSIHPPSISTRCSVHVHLNARDFTMDELYTFILLYMVFERTLYRISGDRWDNIFCVPLTTAIPMIQNTLTYINNGNDLTMLNWWKYLGLNISPLWGGESKHKLGTIEFRQMAGTTNISAIIEWINLIVSLKIAAKRFKKETVRHLLETMNTTSAYYDLAGQVFGEYQKYIIEQPTFKLDVEECISITKKAVFAKELNNVQHDCDKQIGELTCAVL